MKQTKKRMLIVTKRALSVLLVFLMLTSIFTVFNTTAFAVNRDVYYKNTDGYTTVYAYAWDTTNNNDKKLGEWPGTVMERVGSSDYYKISVDSSANYIIFNGGQGVGQTGDLQLPTDNNPVYENGVWSANFDESQYTTSSNEVRDSATYTYDAETTHNFGSGIFAASATYFDYMSDQEITDGYLNPFEAGTGFDGASDHWYPFYRFNRVIKVAADNKSSWTYPLYFGNFCNVGGAYWDYDNNRVNTHGGDFANATNSYNVTRFTYFVNNSNRDYIDHTNNNALQQIGITAENEVVQGLVQSQLNDGHIMATQTMKLPYFDSDFLRKTYEENGTQSSSGTRIAQVFKSYFPFVEDSSKGYTTYSFDSTGAKDNVYFTWNGRVPTAVNYGSGTTYGVKDGLKKFMGNQEAGYGIFPFNNATSTNRGNRSGNSNLDYGFGVRIDIDFRVTDAGTVDGTTNGTPITFNFSGDDDIWVFISDDNGNENLVLDLGGNHKMASGSINFKTMQATADRVYSKTNNSSKGAQTITFNGGNRLSAKKTYHMTVFYMERGLIESNFKMNFSFYPLDNLLTTDKIVETTNVNNGIKEEVAKVDSFTITNKANGSAVASKSFTLDGTTTTTSSSGSYTIKNGQTASFNNIAKTGSTLNVTESIPASSAYKYTTRYTVTDVENNTLIKSGNALTTGDFTFQNTVSANEITNFNVTYYNTPATSSVSLTKKAQKSNGTAVSTDMSFPFTLLLDLDGNGTKYTYQPYQLQYNVSGDSATYPTNTSGKFSIKAGQTVVFNGLPVNAKYKFVETVDEEIYTSDKTNNTVEGTVLEDASSNSVTFTNTMVSTEPTVVPLQAEKLLDGQSSFDEVFSFTLQEVDSSGNKLGDAQTKQNVNKTATGGSNVVEFDPITIVKQENSFTLQNMYVYGNGTTGSAWMNGQNNNTSATVNKMTKVSEGVYEITFNNVPAGSNYTYRFSANGSTAHTFDSKGVFNGTTNTALSVAKSNSTVKLQIDVSGFDFSKNSGNVTVTRTVTPPTETSTSIYMKNSANWSTPYIYYWGGSSKPTWPGVKMTSIGDGMYKYDVPTDSTNVIFNIGSNTNQTNDLEAKFGYVYDNSKKDSSGWSSSPYITPPTPVTTTDTYNNQATTLTYKRYFEIAEVKDSCSSASEDNMFSYDSSKYYAVINVTQTGSKITTTTAYYNTLANAVAGGTTGVVNDVTFRNYHKGKMTITKVDNNGKPIEDEVQFALYKVSKNGDDISGLTPMSTKTVANGVAVFDNLDIYAGQQNHDVSKYQWYCVVESVPKDGYVLDSTKHYFIIPEVKEVNTSVYDLVIDGKKYSYVLKNGEKIYNIKYQIANAPLTVPKTSGSGTTKFIYTGFAVMTLGISLAGYMAINRRKRKREL